MAHRRRRDVEDKIEKADLEIRTLAEEQGWSFELHPSSALWYRLRGSDQHAIPWDLIESHPGAKQGLVRWSTDEIRLPTLFLKFFPRTFYERLKSGSQPPNAETRRDFLASRKLINDGHVVPLENKALNQHYVLVAVAPTFAKTLFSSKVEQALLSLHTHALRIGLGFPNLRVSLTRKKKDLSVLPRLVDLGLLLANDFRDLRRKGSLTDLTDQ